MDKNKKYILKWEIAGAFFLIIVGSLLHFAYAWSGYNPFIGMISGVNESVWEHLKLGYWSLVFFILIEYWFIRKKTSNFCIAKAAGIFAMQLFIVGFFYAYTLFTEEILIIDIISYIIGCILCQFISYKILIANKLDNVWNVIGIIFLTFHAIILIAFTFNPPEKGIFLEHSSGRYGTTWNYEPEEDEHDH
ncbi:hypothetical protein KKC88_05275 [Patescibacteria group bacterium]|nr:hypothetical protein [Patescibacteria group bacterium]MBU1673600.1 hypothetical protein [Patescibacteria group bacterium]MBU1964038.1 hypothetical protein [Patescibacteria group bacterium]